MSAENGVSTSKAFNSHWVFWNSPNVEMTERFAAAEIFSKSVFFDPGKN